MEEKWTILRVLRWTTGYFSSKGIEQPRADAEVLLAHVLGWNAFNSTSNNDKHSPPMSLPASRTRPAQGRFRADSIHRGQAGVLVTRIRGDARRAHSATGNGNPGRKGARTTNGVPALSWTRDRVGGDSGALAHDGNIRVNATDKSFPALAVAKKNAARHAVSGREHSTDGPQEASHRDRGSISLFPTSLCG